MSLIPSRLFAAVVASSLLVASGPAFAQDHGGPGRHEPDHAAHRVIRGVLESGSLTGMFVTLQTASGQQVRLTITPKTRIALEAQGTAGGILAALNAHQLAVTANVVSQSQTWVATAIEAHLNVGSSDHSDGDQGGGGDAHHHSHDS